MAGIAVLQAAGTGRSLGVALEMLLPALGASKGRRAVFLGRSARSGSHVVGITVDGCCGVEGVS